ncbi:MAG: RluA family pseudouridine synthase [Candidatus Margulisiibacteriota bacterium]
MTDLIQIELSVFSNQHQRLDKYLTEVLFLSREIIKELISNKGIRVNGIQSKPSYKVQQKDQIHIAIIQLNNDSDVQSILEQNKTLIRTTDFLIPILYEDDHLLVVNKPWGLLMHEAVSNTSDSLVGILQRAGYSLFCFDGQRPGIVHRLDQYTEGVSVIVKTSQSYHSLKLQFKERLVTKKYYAVLKGVLQSLAGEITFPIGRDISIRARKSCNAFVPGTEKSACTKYQVLHQSTNLTLVDVHLVTGRTHQIRVHFSALQCPVLGDPLYSKQAKRREGYYLQSYFIGFNHPVSNQWLTFQQPISKRLNKYANKSYND